MPAEPKPIDNKPAKSAGDNIVSSMEGMDPGDPHPAEEGDPYDTRRADRPATTPRPSFTAQEIAQIRRLLQEAADEPPEALETKAVFGRLRDEIDTLRRDGMSNDDVAALLSQGSGATITAEQVAQYYGAPQDR